MKVRILSAVRSSEFSASQSVKTSFVRCKELALFSKGSVMKGSTVLLCIMNNIFSLL